MIDRPGARPSRRRLAAGTLALLLALPCGPLPSAGAQPATATPVEAKAAIGPQRVERELWYVVEFGGQRAGWTVERQFLDDDTGGAERIVSEAETQLRIERGGTVVELAFSSRFVETAAGEPIAMRAVQQLGPRPVVTEITFETDAAIERSGEGEGASERRRPLPAGEWLTPAAAQRQLEAALRTGAEQYRVQVLDPLAGLTPVVVEASRIAELPGGGSRWRQSVSTMPGVAGTVDYSADGEMLRSVTVLLGLEMVTRQVERGEALAGGGPAPELLVSSLIHPDRVIERPRQLRRGVYRLSFGDADPELPTTGTQTVEPEPNGAVRVTVDVRGSHPAAGAAAGDEQQLADGDRQLYLRATPYLDHTAAAVRALLDDAAVDAAGGATVRSEGRRSAGRRAERLRRYVHRVMTAKNLATGFASAGEVAVTLSGDCTEHAVLLTALLRAAGIPARVVSGLLYVESFAGESDVFGYHMWSQAWIEGRWVDLDAMGTGEFDATHIALATSPLDDQEDFLQVSTSLAPAMGSLRIEVLAASEP